MHNVNTVKFQRGRFKPLKARTGGAAKKSGK